MNIKGVFKTSIVAIATIIAISAMSFKTTEKKPLDAPYYYKGPITTDMTVIRNLTNWQSTPNPSFECEGEDPVPCSLNAESTTDLQNKLNSYANINVVNSNANSLRKDAE